MGMHSFKRRISPSSLLILRKEGAGDRWRQKESDRHSIRNPSRVNELLRTPRIVERNRSFFSHSFFYSSQTHRSECPAITHRYFEGEREDNGGTEGEDQQAADSKCYKNDELYELGALVSFKSADLMLIQGDLDHL